MDEGEKFDTIERWNTKDPTAVWHYINVKGDKLYAVQFPLMTVLSETEIVIMHDSDDWYNGRDSFEDNNKTFVINIKTGECKMVAQEEPSLDFSRYHCCQEQPESLPS